MHSSFRDEFCDADCITETIAIEHAGLGHHRSCMWSSAWLFLNLNMVWPMLRPLAMAHSLSTEGIAEHTGRIANATTQSPTGIIISRVGTLATAYCRNFQVRVGPLEVRTPRGRWKLPCRWSAWEEWSCQRRSPVLTQHYAGLCTEEHEFAVLAWNATDLVGFKGTYKPVFLHTTDVDSSPRQSLHLVSTSSIQGSRIPSGYSDIGLGLLILLNLLCLLGFWLAWFATKNRPLGLGLALTLTFQMLPYIISTFIVSFKPFCVHLSVLHRFCPWFRLYRSFCTHDKS